MSRSYKSLLILSYGETLIASLEHSHLGFHITSTRMRRDPTLAISASTRDSEEQHKWCRGPRDTHFRGSYFRLFSPVLFVSN